MLDHIQMAYVLVETLQMGISLSLITMRLNTYGIKQVVDIMMTWDTMAKVMLMV